MSDETNLIPVRHVYGGAFVDGGVGYIAGDWDVVEPPETPTPQKWFRAVGAYNQPLIMVWAADLSGQRMRGTFYNRIDAFDFARQLLEQHNQVEVVGVGYRLLLDRRGDLRRQQSTASRVHAANRRMEMMFPNWMNREGP